VDSSALLSQSLSPGCGLLDRAVSDVSNPCGSRTLCWITSVMSVRVRKLPSGLVVWLCVLLGSTDALHP